MLLGITTHVLACVFNDERRALNSIGNIAPDFNVAAPRKVHFAQLLLDLSRSFGSVFRRQVIDPLIDETKQNLLLFPR